MKFYQNFVVPAWKRSIELLGHPLFNPSPVIGRCPYDFEPPLGETVIFAKIKKTKTRWYVWFSLKCENSESRAARSFCAGRYCQRKSQKISDFQNHSGECNKKSVFFLLFFYRGYRVLKNSFFNVSKPRRHRGLIFLRFFSIFPQSGMMTFTFDEFHHRHGALFFSFIF